jgi:hypothetical protein
MALPPVTSAVFFIAKYSLFSIFIAIPNNFKFNEHHCSFNSDDDARINSG